MSFKQLLHKYRNFNRKGWHGQTCLSVLCLMFSNFKLIAQPSRLRKEKSHQRLNFTKPTLVILVVFVGVYIHHGVVARRALPLHDVLNLVSSANAVEAKEKKILYWTCGMHPSVKMDKPGKCPICAMDIVPVYEKDVGAEEEGALATIELSERAKKLASVKTDVVGYRPLTKDIYTVGLIDYDERLKAFVSAWVPERIDKLFLDFTGTHRLLNDLVYERLNYATRINSW